MINKRRILTVIFCLSLLMCSILCFAACGDEDESEDKPSGKKITSIAVEYTQGDELVYPDTLLDELRGSIVVTVRYSNGSTKEVTDYTLSGILAEGISVVTVSYKGFEDTFTVFVSGNGGEHRHFLVRIVGKPSTCTVNGNIEYWTCSECDKCFADQEGSAEIALSDTVILASHTGGTEIKDAKAPSVEEEGYTGDTYCKGCGEMLEAGEVIGKLDHVHNMFKTDSKEATCTEDGNIEYWTCSVCGKHYTDGEGIREIDFAQTVIAAYHSMTHIEAQPSTCTVNGNIEYWACSGCDKCFADQEGSAEIALSDTVIPASHTGGTEIKDAKAPSVEEEGYSGDIYCLGCGEMLFSGVTLPQISAEPTIIVSHKAVEGDTVKVIISLANNPGIVSLKFGVYYDSILSIESIEFANELGAYVTAPQPYFNPQTINWISPGENQHINGEFVTITFSISADAEEGAVAEIYIIPDEANIFDSTMSQIQFNTVGTQVTVNE